MSETRLEVRSADGAAEAYLYKPLKGGEEFPGVVFLTDIMGIRKANLGMAQRIAEQGYVVLVPNIFYRVTKLPVVDFELKFGDERTMRRMGELRAGLTSAQMGPDGASYTAWLLAQKDVRHSKVAVVGYCFTGQMALRTAAATPDKIVAAASFHGGGLCTNESDSPHLLLPKITARIYIGHAVEDRSMPKEAIVRLDAALAAWGGHYESEVYEGAHHGWTVPGRPEVYNQLQAERHYVKLFETLEKSFA